MAKSPSIRRPDSGASFPEVLIITFIISLIVIASYYGSGIIERNRARRTLGDMHIFAGQQQAFFKRHGRFAGDGDGDGIIDFTKLDLAPIAFDDVPAPGLISANTPDIDAAFAELRHNRLFIGSNNPRIGSNPYRGATYFASKNGRNVIVITNLTCDAATYLDMAVDASVDASAGLFQDAQGADSWESACNTPTGRANGIYFFTERTDGGS